MTGETRNSKLDHRMTGARCARFIGSFSSGYVSRRQNLNAG